MRCKLQIHKLNWILDLVQLQQLVHHDTPVVTLPEFVVVWRQDATQCSINVCAYLRISLRNVWAMLYGNSFRLHNPDVIMIILC